MSLRQAFIGRDSCNMTSDCPLGCLMTCKRVPQSVLESRYGPHNILSSIITLKDMCRETQ